MKGAPVIKQFLAYHETAVELQTDDEGLRQALEIGLAQELPPFVHCGARPYLARLVGGIQSAERDEATETNKITLKSGITICEQFFVKEGSPSEIGDMDLGDGLADVMFTDLGSRATGYPCTFELRGFFRVGRPYAMKKAAREAHLGMADVAPASWWEGGAPRLLGFNDRGPTLFFQLLPSEDPRFLELPDLTDLYFRASDVRDFAARPQGKPIQNSKALDTRERTTLLCIIGALAKHANLDLSQPMKAGNAIAAMLPGDVKLSGRTIGEHLKGVREALDSRKG